MKLLTGRFRRLHLLHVTVQREQVLPHGRRQKAEPPLVLRVAPPRVVKRSRGVEVEAGAQTAPAVVFNDSILSWIERTSRRRDLSAISASTAAEVADIVVRYGTPYVIAARRIA